MKVLRSDKLIFVDVDNTLVTWKDSKEEYGIDDYTWAQGAIKVGIAEFKATVLPNENQIEFIHNLKAQGNTIIVWSHGGYEWATAVVKALEMEDIVDVVMSKPCLYIDDLEVSTWFPRKLWKHPNPTRKN